MRELRLAGAISILCVGAFAANTAFMGTWKLNKEKSTFSAGTEPKEVTVVFEAAGDKVNAKRHLGRWYCRQHRPDAARDGDL